jgi:hypothetical protein
MYGSLVPAGEGHKRLNRRLRQFRRAKNPEFSSASGGGRTGLNNL